MAEPAAPTTVDDVDTLLRRFLDLYRSVAVAKIEGLTTEQATAEATPTGMTLLGLLKHLVWDERIWFEYHFLGHDVQPLDTDESFRIGPTDTLDSVLADHRAACARTDQIVADAPSWDAVVTIPHDSFGAVDLRWIIVHMIEEIARHVGHMDILREQTDGRTGWM